MTLADDFLGGLRLPGFSSSSGANSSATGAQQTPWYQGDIVVATSGSTATGGNKSYPTLPPMGVIGGGGALDFGGALNLGGGGVVQPGAPGVSVGAGIGVDSRTLLIAGAAIVGVLVWRVMRK